eukprot:gene17433-20031_t
MATRHENPAPGCPVSQEQLMTSKDPLNIYDDCPICRDDYNVLCRVAKHPSRSIDTNVQAHSEWTVNFRPHVILGDNVDGPHSSAIIIGRRTVLGCAHSLGLSEDETQRHLRGRKYYKYLEDYWIQPFFTRNSKGEFTKENRIPLKLYKIARAGEFSVSCQISSVHVQGQSSHHVKYEGRDLCRGSSGGGVYVAGSTSVLGMHIEAVTEADYDPDDPKQNIVHTDKRVSSEEQSYDPFEESAQTHPKKKLKSDSETLASVANGNNGLGSAIIICKFPRLLAYINESGI